MSAQKQLKEYFERLEKNYIQLMAMADSLPKELAEKSEAETVFFRNLKINIPYDLTSLRQTRKLLGAEWRFVKTWGGVSLDHTYQCYTYQHPDFNLPFEISLQLDKTGSTCKIEKVGEELKEIYKVICD